MNHKLKLTLFEVWAGIGATGIVGVVVLGLVTGFLSRETIGFAVGILASFVLFYSMSVSVETALDTGDGRAAKRKIRTSYLMRMAAIILGTYAIMKWDKFDVVAALLALFSIKVGAWFQPITHQLFCRWFHIRDELDPEALYLPAKDEEEDDEGEEKIDRIDRWLDKVYGKREK